MRFHSNAATNLRQRHFIRHSKQSCRSLASQLCVSPATIHTWKHRLAATDRSCRPHTLHTAFDEAQEQLVLWLRHMGQLSLDDLLDAVQGVVPHARRSSVHRLLVRHGCSRLPRQNKETPGKFKPSVPGFLHMDFFHLPQFEGQAFYCFVAIDRATRLVFLHVYEQQTKESATDFLQRCLEFYPFAIHTILTDNGRQFTLADFKNRWGNKTSKTHPFDEVCHKEKIEHRLTRPYTPKTNGMVERVNGLIQQNTTHIHSYQSAQQMKQHIHLWWVRYNFYRAHRRIGRITPYQAVCHWQQSQPLLFHKPPTSLLDYRS